jgi:hypothetical protein
VGTENYGDAVLLELGGDTILIDGAHPSNWRDQGDSSSIPDQLGSARRWRTADSTFAHHLFAPAQ